MSAIHPREVLGSTGLVLVDLRPLGERIGGMGFPPGSLGMPWAPDAVDYTESVRAAAGGRAPVLVCLSGARARARSLAVGGALPYLEGGVLAWSAEGLPLCGRSMPATDEPLLALDEIPRYLAACFVGELAELAIDRPELDPLALLHRCFERAGVSQDAPSFEGLLRVLDQAALTSLELGTPLSKVATNVDHMLARLPLPERSRVA